MKYFMTETVHAVRPSARGDENRRHVVLTLDCGCRVERTVDASRVLEVEDLDGQLSYFVAGKFTCERHSPEPQ